MMTVTFTAFCGLTVISPGTKEIHLAAECGSVPGGPNFLGLPGSCHQSQAYALTVMGSVPELKRRMVCALVLPFSNTTSRNAGEAPMEMSAWAAGAASSSSSIHNPNHPPCLPRCKVSLLEDRRCVCHVGGERPRRG